MSHTRISALLLCTMAVSIPPADAQTPESPCNPRLTPKSGKAEYKRRVNRCEGLYERLVALGSLRPVSLIREDLPVTEAPFRLTWPAAAQQGLVSVQAVGFREGELYRMDAVASGTSFTWESDVLRDLGLEAGQFGVLAMTDVGSGENARRIYLPVALGPTRQSPANPHSYVLKMVSAEDLSDVFLSVSGPVIDGKPPETVFADRSLKRPYYSSATPLEIQLELPATEGVYQVRVAGKRMSGNGSTTSTFYVQNGK